MKEFDAMGIIGLYLIGDLVVGKKGGSIITAFNSSVRAMMSICSSYLPCKSNPSRNPAEVVQVDGVA